MIEILRQELRKVAGRRGSFWSAIGLTFALIATIVVASIIVDATQDDPTGGKEAVDLYTGLLFVPLVAFVLVASLGGAWDFANGTFRYLVVTGRRPWQLVAFAGAGVTLASLTVTAPYVVAGIAQAFIFPQDEFGPNSGPASGSDIASFVWWCFAQVTFWSIVAFAVGALLRSSGAGIAVALVFFFGGFPLAALISVLSETLAEAMPNIAITIVAGGDVDDEASLPQAIVTTIGWLVAFIGAAIFRAERSEY
ncbi:MAG: hypothetical protein ACKVVT_14680 [Dehalococcoidia bacterium]